MTLVVSSSCGRAMAVDVAFREMPFFRPMFWVPVDSHRVGSHSDGRTASSASVSAGMKSSGRVTHAA